MYRGRRAALLPQVVVYDGGESRKASSSQESRFESSSETYEASSQPSRQRAILPVGLGAVRFDGALDGGKHGSDDCEVLGVGGGFGLHVGKDLAHGHLGRVHAAARHVGVYARREETDGCPKRPTQNAAQASLEGTALERGFDAQLVPRFHFVRKQTHGKYYIFSDPLVWTYERGH